MAGWIWRLYHATEDGRLFNYPVHLSSIRVLLESLDGARTKVILVGEVHLRGIHKPMELVMRWVARRQFGTQLRTLKNLL